MLRKSRRAYDSRKRREHARRAREAVVEAARAQFLSAGYGATTIAEVARAAGVSAETIYKSFGGKPGLIRAIYEQGLAGRGAIPAYERSDHMSSREADPREILCSWGRLAAEVSPLVSPILLLVRSAATTDAELAALAAKSDHDRLLRMRKNARVLARRGFLRSGVTARQAADLMWTLTSPELYDCLVSRRGWSARRFGDFVAETMIAALL
jgi:AcrR family transcriptional regulator